MTYINNKLIMGEEWKVGLVGSIQTWGGGSTLGKAEA